MPANPFTKLPAVAVAVAVAVATALISAFGLAGCAAVATSPKAATVADTMVDASAADGRGSLHLTAYTNGDGPTDTVIVTGAIGDYGEAVSVYPNGTVDPGHDSELSLKLSRGSFRLDIAALDKAFAAAVLRVFPTDAGTCSGSVAVTRRVPIVPGSGSGAYRGVRGALTLTATLDEVDTVSAAQPCDGTGAFLSQAIVITGPGTVTG